jgi:hypothetical protein
MVLKCWPEAIGRRQCADDPLTLAYLCGHRCSTVLARSAYSEEDAVHDQNTNTGKLGPLEIWNTTTPLTMNELFRKGN